MWPVAELSHTQNDESASNEGTDCSFWTLFVEELNANHELLAWRAKKSIIGTALLLGKIRIRTIQVVIGISGQILH